jgi:cell division septal protein FtsQ
MLEERRDQHYLRRPGNLAVRRNRWRRGVLRRTFSLVLQLLLLVGLWLAGRQVYLAAITSPYFEVKTVAIRGNRQARTADLLALCSSVLSKNIFRIELETLRLDLRRNPWVLDVAARRSLPSTVEVAVVEREPVAIASFEGRSYLLDATGRVLSEYGPGLGGYDFPVLTGFEGVPRPEAMRRIRAGAAAVSALTASKPDFARRISEIDLSGDGRIALRPADASPVLYLSREDPLRNLDEYAAISGLIPRRLPPAPDGAPARIAYVDLRFRGRIAVMPRETTSAAQPGTDKSHGQETSR